MSDRFEFSATIENAGGGGAFVRIPFDVEQAFGKKRVKIKAYIGTEEYRGTLVRMGEPCHILLILKSIREKLGKEFGEQIAISLEEDSEPREVIVPTDLREALAAAGPAQQLFDKLSYTHKKEYVVWINEAKRAETRTARIQKAVALLNEGKRSR